MRLVLPLLLWLAGCRLGGPTGAPAPPPDAAVLADDAGAGRGADLASVALDALAPPDGAPDEATPIDGAAPASACGAPFAPAVCDPVCNTGCPGLSRCDVGATPRAGACVGIWVNTEGQSCFKGSGTDACAPRLTCLGGVCRRLCYGDGHCAAGACCKQPVKVGGAASGFLVCAPC